MQTYITSLYPTNLEPVALVWITVLLRGYDDDYHKDDILKHINMLDLPGQWLLESLVLDPISEERDENGKEWTKETFFQKYIPNTFLKSRSILLGSLKNGLTINGDNPNPSVSDDLLDGCGISAIFSHWPIEAIQRIHFSKSRITLEDLLGALNPRFGEGGMLCTLSLLIEKIVHALSNTSISTISIINTFLCRTRYCLGNEQGG